MVAVDLEVNQPRERATVDVAFDVLAALIEGRDIVVLLQVGYGVQDFFVKAVAEAVLLAVVPVALREELVTPSNCTGLVLPFLRMLAVIKVIEVRC